MIPQIDNSLDSRVLEIITYPNKTYKLNKTQIAGKVDELEAIQQAIYHILSIERYAYLIYDDNYGVELEQYIGQSFEFLESTIENTLKEALKQDDRILNIKVTSITKSYANQEKENPTTSDNSALLQSSVNRILIANVEFDAYCKQGVIHTEVKVNV